MCSITRQLSTVSSGMMLHHEAALDSLERLCAPSRGSSRQSRAVWCSITRALSTVSSGYVLHHEAALDSLERYGAPSRGRSRQSRAVMCSITSPLSTASSGYVLHHEAALDSLERHFAPSRGRSRSRQSRAVWCSIARPLSTVSSGNYNIYCSRCNISFIAVEALNQQDVDIGSCYSSTRALQLYMMLTLAAVIAQQEPCSCIWCWHWQLLQLNKSLAAVYDVDIGSCYSSTRALQLYMMLRHWQLL